ncbi:MAG: GspE/PulE family protein [Candidatus Dependentiae bacterium]|jgi:type II secretory ATPase GspE/PulE/Tfp pilus assembly ATPase PilB-like protein
MSDDRTRGHHTLLFTGQQSNEETVSRLLQSLIEAAHATGASDIHVQPLRTHVVVRLRCDGMLQQYTMLSAQQAATLVAHCKVLAGLDSCLVSVPQDGTIQVTAQRTVYDARLSSFPTLYGEKLVLRLLAQVPCNSMLTSLGLPASTVTALQRIAQRQQGFFLVTGPTGSGKTTTLYAMLHEVDAEQRNIITLEDPIEYRVPLVTHSQINEASGFTFARAMRAVLRQDPDVALIGEIRDEQTARTALEAALTGHLVLSSLHTTRAHAAPLRLQRMGIEPAMIASSLTGVLAQRLVPLVCTKCADRRNLTPEEQAWCLEQGVEIDSTTVVVGCVECQRSGYAGRTVVSELLLGGAMTLGESESLLQDGLRLVGEGRVAIESIMAL